MKIKKLRIFSRVFCVLLAGSAFLAEAEVTSSNSVSMTIQRVVDEALRNNPELRFYEAEIDAAKGERKTAGTWNNPELSRSRVQSSRLLLMA